ncbi:MAG: alpha-2-macroglobulin family protein, partial [Syntrophothermus sp.]
NSSNGIVSAGYTSLLLSSNLPNDFNLKKDSSVMIFSENLNHQKTPGLVDIEIQRLKQPEQMVVLRKWDTPIKTYTSTEDRIREKWPVEKTVLNKTMDTGKDSVLYLKKDIQDFAPGVYKMIMKAKDPFGKVTTSTKTFLVFDPDAKVSPVNEMNWFYELSTTAEPGENAEFLLGTREKDVNVLYEILVNDSIISRQWIKLDNEMRKLSIPVKEQYRGGFWVNLIFIRNNNAYANSFGITVPYSNKKLNLKLETFRDKMVPGEKEEWKLKISGPDNRPEKAELLAGMYDASLDIFEQNNWYYNIWYPHYSNHPWSYETSFRTESAWGSEALKQIPVPERYFEKINWIDGVRHERYSMSYRSESTMAMDVLKSDELPPPPPPPAGEVLAMEVRTSKASEVPPAQIPATKPIPVKIRSDFRETAFFYPSLVTDSSGSIILKFTAPESLTRWKLMGIAHTKDLKIGQITKEVVTQKDLMVFPNAPRFVRQGDTVVFSTGVVNLSDRALDGDVKLEISDPVTGLPLKMMLDEASRHFTIPAGQKIAASWKLAIPVDPSVSMMQYRITAVSGNFSDGEEKMIPVLTNRMMVTESVPLPVRGSGTFDFSFDKLKNLSKGKTLKNYRLTLEFASNPVWYAVQSLPVLDEPRYQSADAVFNTFYANSIAMNIANSDPAVKKVFESWKRLTPEALLSNLEKNQELKSAVLDETPWVMEAKDESQQKQRIGELFDEANMNAKIKSSLSKLITLQRPEGGWSWFEGMTPSQYTTQQIVCGFGHLSHLGITDIRNDKEAGNMISKAVLFTDHELVRDYEWLKKNVKNFEKQDNLSAQDVYYLYGRSYYLKDIPLEKSTQEAFDFYRRQAEKYWTKQSIYFQGMIALSLNRLGNKSLPAMIMKSLSEKALHSPEMGMYWAMNEGYYWYEAPVETQALLIEAFDEVLADRASVDEMKIWLLKNKQTNGWKTGRATAEACYAMLLRGNNLLDANQKVTFEVGNEKIDPAKLADTRTEAGTGYFKLSWDGKEINPAMGDIKVTKTGDGVAWGAMYWQYFEDLDKITRAQSPLKLEKSVTVVTVTPSGPKLVPVTNATALQPGDKLKIRVVVTADRDLEYVHLKDMRAGALEPVAEDAISGYRFREGLGYYQSVSDVAMNFFFDYLPKGTYVFEYPLVVNAAGNYSNGITTIQCLYAPEFGAHSEGVRIEVR